MSHLLGERSGSPLPIAVVVPRCGLRQWQVQAITGVERDGLVRVVALLEVDAAPGRPGNRAVALLAALESLAQRKNRGADVAPSLHQLQSADAVWPHAQRVAVTRSGGVPAAMERWPLIVNLSCRSLSERLTSRATIGVLELRLGRSHDLDDALEFCRRGKNTIRVSGVLVAPAGRVRVEQSVTGVRERTLVVASLELILARAETVLARVLTKVCRMQPTPSRRWVAPPDRPAATLSWGSAASLIGSAVVDYAKWMRTRVQSGTPGWFLAYRASPAHFIGRNLACSSEAISVIPSPPDRFYADPCVFSHDGVDHVFFEDFRYASGRAVISWMGYTAGGGFTDPQPVLERPYHLAYPLVFAHDGEIFMLPDTAEPRQVELYRATEFPTRWEHVAVLLKNVHAADATVFQHEGLWWMFVSLATPRASLCDELSLFYAESPLGPWHPHPANPVKSDVRSARCAGRPFYHGNRLVRPAQNCSRLYGGAVALCEVRELTTSRFSERVIAEVDGTWLSGNARFHTLSFSDRLEVLDGSFYAGVA